MKHNTTQHTFTHPLIPQRKHPFTSLTHSLPPSLSKREKCPLTLQSNPNRVCYAVLHYTTTSSSSTSSTTTTSFTDHTTLRCSAVVQSIERKTRFTTLHNRMLHICSMPPSTQSSIHIHHHPSSSSYIPPSLINNDANFSTYFYV
jgi:hypothetical protein